MTASLFATTGSYAQTVLFEDDFDSEVVTVFNNAVNQTLPVGTTGWTFIGQEANQNDGRYGFDYGTLGIPEAPNSDVGDTATTGVSLRTNVSAGRASQAGVYYEDESFTGQYRVQVDMYLSWAAEPELQGTTEHGGLFIGSDTPTNPAFTDDNAPGFADRAYPASAGAGAIFSSDGDTTNFDFLLLKNNVYPTIGSGQYSVTDFGFGTQLGYDNTDVNTNPANGDLIDLPALFPEIDPGGGVIQRAGAIGYQWVTLVADVDTEALGSGAGTVPGLTTFSVEIANTGESFTLGTLDNSIIDDPLDGPVIGFDDAVTDQGPVDMSGRVTLTIIDFFTSVASDINLATAVFDNLIVTQVESGGLAADFNGDGTVDLLDLDILGSNFGLDPATMAEGDANGDMVVNLLDLDILGTEFGMSASSSVPEPTAVVLVLLAAGGLAARRR